eukprot:6853763-Prymnesium_polylepis.1
MRSTMPCHPGPVTGASVGSSSRYAYLPVMIGEPKAIALSSKREPQLPMFMFCLFARVLYPPTLGCAPAAAARPTSLQYT